MKEKEIERLNELKKIENEIYEKIQNSRLQQRNKRKLRKNACDTPPNML